MMTYFGNFRFWTYFILFTSIVLGAACTETPREHKIAGQIDLSPELQKKLNPKSVLYVIARQEGQKTGAPVAVRRFIQPLSFPIQFNITQQDVMLPDTQLNGKYSVTARIAQTGSATPVRAGDIIGSSNLESVSTSADNKAQNLRIKLDQVFEASSVTK